MIAPFFMFVYMLRNRFSMYYFLEKNVIKKAGKGCNIKFCVLVYKYRY